jgi:hypothetical protein
MNDPTIQIADHLHGCHAVMSDGASGEGQIDWRKSAENASQPMKRAAARMSS